MDLLIGFLILFSFFLSVFLYSLYIDWKNKIKITKEHYDKNLKISIYRKLCNKSIHYLKAFENDKNYTELEMAFSKLSSSYNMLALEILNTPLQLAPPPDPHTTALHGTLIGGSAVGMVAAQKTIKQKQEYKKNLKAIATVQVNTKKILSEADLYYKRIESIIEENENIRTDWNKEKEIILKDFKKKYRIR